MTTMMRNLLHSEPYLVQLINGKEWDKVVSHLQDHPEDAAPNYSINRGVESSALARAVQRGAPFETLVALTEASVLQVVRARHYRQGTVLHEAIRSRASARTIHYFVNVVISYEKDQIWIRRGELKPIDLKFGISSLTKSSVRNDPFMPPDRKTVSTCTTVFNQTDSLGRTPLHLLIGRISAPTGKDCREELIGLVKTLAGAFPPAIGREDSDGLTPLDLALLSDKAPNELQEMEVEMRLYTICKILIEEFPSAAFPSFKPAKAEVHSPIGSPVRQSRDVALQILNENNDHMVARSRRILSDSVEGSIKHNPLSRALLYGRHISTIELILEASKLSQTSWCTGQLSEFSRYGSELHSGDNQCCMAIVTNDFEVPLHIAVTMGASSDILNILNLSAFSAAAIPDRCGLTPLCWAWIRHVAGQDRIRASRRRFIPLNYEEMNKVHTLRIARRVLDNAYQTILNNKEREFFRKILCLLPAAAAATALSLRNQSKNKKLSKLESVASWSPLHAASFVECPRAVVLVAVADSPESLKVKDSLGNLPIHYAAARHGYAKSLSVGPTATPCHISEASAVYDLIQLYPNATKVANDNLQLPLHVAIETEKRLHKHIDDLNRTASRTKRIPRKAQVNISTEVSIPIFMSNFDPDALEVKDGLTGVYPFILAAIGKFSSLDTVYKLLRECPTLVHY